ncbi:MAG: gamma-glutamyl-gamma-aminobutyrate hydrolase family protein [Clostridia bacterium]|nr:gamma-glutamyl-gamma-aminobutyrate hydrolase family protein [Clostridia bacterium]
MRPTIGLTCSMLENSRLAVNLTYLNALRASGALPVTLPYVETVGEAELYLNGLDGFLFTGGADIDPAEYGEQKDEKCGEVCPPRDLTEKCFFEALKNKRLPTLGICRGIQTLNVFAGGTLWQDIPSQYGADIVHASAEHDIDIVPGTLFAQVIGKERIKVNSFHHQGIKTLAPGYAVCARAPDGMPEAICAESRDDFLAVQYHPEMICSRDENARAVFDWFTRVCADRKQKGKLV